jgi:hypothetical protein
MWITGLYLNSDDRGYAEVLYHSFKKFAASRPKAMKKPLSPVIASAAKQSPGRYGDCFAACGGSQCNGRKFSTATRMGRVEEFKFPEGKIHYPCLSKP